MKTFWSEIWAQEWNLSTATTLCAGVNHTRQHLEPRSFIINNCTLVNSNKVQFNTSDSDSAQLFLLHFCLQPHVLSSCLCFSAFIASHSLLLSASLLLLFVVMSVSFSSFHSFTTLCVVSLLLSFSALPLAGRQSSLAAAASFCSVFATNGPLHCCVQGNKSHQAETQVLWLPLRVGQSGQFSVVWWAVWYRNSSQWG